MLIFLNCFFLNNQVDSGTIVEPPKKLLLQLSSPIEEAVLYLPPTITSSTNSTTTFRGVETGQATLSITVEWDTTTTTIEKSETTYMDVSKFTHELLNVLQQPPPSSSSPNHQESHETTLRIPLLPMATTIKEEATTKTSDVVNTEAAALCTITINVKYIPSYKDIREELCDCIGKIATQKAIAREELRKASLIVHELSSSSNTTGTKNPKPSTAVKSGFLQKDKPTTTASGSSNSDGTSSGDSGTSKPWYTTTIEWYNRTIVTNAMVIVPVLTNYIFFIAFTVVTHYYGHQLAIPPPV